jgi:hypothetical protein
MTVHVTEALKITIRDRFIHKLKQAFDGSVLKVSPELADSIYDFVIGSDVGVLNSVPSQYLNYVPGIFLEFTVSGSRCLLPVNFSSSRPWVNLGNYRTLSTPPINGRLSVYNAVLNRYRIHDIGAWDHAIMDGLTTVAESMHVRDTNITNVQDNLAILLKQNRTLRQLLKAFPPIKPFVSPHIIEKLAGEPAARVGKYEGVDREFLTGMAAMARMME